jgi:hypothetical protein
MENISFNQTVTGNHAAGLYSTTMSVPRNCVTLDLHDLHAAWQSVTTEVFFSDVLHYKVPAVSDYARLREKVAQCLIWGHICHRISTVNEIHWFHSFTHSLIHSVQVVQSVKRSQGFSKHWQCVQCASFNGRAQNLLNKMS